MSARSASAAIAGASTRAYSGVRWNSSSYTRVLPTMGGQRSAVQNNSVTSAYCPPGALVAALSAAIPDLFTAVDFADEQAVALSR